MKKKEIILADGTVIQTNPDDKGRRKNYIKEEVFIIGILLIPLAWWLFGFIYMTGESIILAFKEYIIVDYNTGTGYYVTAGQSGFANIISVFQDFVDPSRGSDLSTCLKNSFILWGINNGIILPINVVISFALHKKIYGQGVFKVILILPQIVSATVWVLIYSTLIRDGGAAIYGRLNDLNWVSPLETKGSDFWLLLVYQIWMTLANGMVIYTGAMSRVPDSLVEAGHLDGMKDFQEFIYIVIPLIFPTLSVVLTTAVTTIFTTSLPTYAFFGALQGSQKHLMTFGHYMFENAQNSASKTGYPMVSAVSLIMCLIATPFTLTVKHLLTKYGPTVEY